MATNNNSRLRLFYLIEILTMYTDEYNFLTIEEITEKLKEYGYDVTKRTVLADIKIINSTTVKVVSVSKPEKGYYLAKSYSQYAIHLILEAVFSSDSLSESDMKYIVNYLKRNICLPTLDLILSTTQNYNAHSPRKEISSDVLHSLRTAIKSKTQIQITVSRPDLGDCFSDDETFETVTVNPLKIAVAYRATSLIFSCSESPTKVEYINLSRIKSAETTAKNAVLTEYDPKLVVNCFDGNRSKVSYSSTEWLVLRFKNKYIELIENHFSSPVKFRKDEKEGYCVAKALTAVNTELLGWLFIHSDKIEILSPGFLIELFEEKGKNFK